MMSVVCVSGCNVVISVSNFSGDPYDGETLLKILSPVRSNCGKAFEKVLVSRGYVSQGVQGKS